MQKAFLTLSSEQLGLLSAVVKSPRLKQQLLAASVVLPVGTCLPVAEQLYRVLAFAGAGLIGSVYRVQALDGEQIYALKQIRASVAFLRQLLATEAEVTRLLQQAGWAVATVVAQSETALLKSWVTGPTLQALLMTETATPVMTAAVEKMLAQAADFYHRKGYLLDLSPKNLLWQQTHFCLLDTGPKIQPSPYVELLDAPHWQQYLAYFSPKLKQAESRPSVLSMNLPEPSLQVLHQVFLEPLLTWLPVDAEPLPFFAQTLAGPQSDLLFRSESSHTESSHIGANLELETAADYTRPLRGQNPLLRALAQQVTKQKTGLLLPEVWPAGSSPLALQDCLQNGLKQGLNAAWQSDTAEPLQISARLQVLPYRHWSDLALPEGGHRPTDIYCHDPLPLDLHFAQTYLSQVPHFRLSLSPWPERAFLELLVVSVGHAERTFLLLPGFRAKPEAALPLLAALQAGGLEGRFLIAYLGGHNPQGQRLLGGGVLETQLLWYLLEYLAQYWQCPGLTLMAASYACISAVLLSGVHPLIERLVLDSPVKRPMDLLFYLGQCHGVSPQTLQAELAVAGLPSVPFEQALRLPQGFPHLVLHPEQDKFTQICGRLDGENTAFYSGKHAASLRHDTWRKGIPLDCLDALLQFLA